MSTSLYDLSIPVFVRALTNLTHILDKAAAHAESEGKTPESLLEARLYPDMAPLAYQIQRVSDGTRNFAQRVGGIDNPAMADTETTFAELKTRIANTIAYLQAVPRAVIDGKEEAVVELKTPRATMQFTGLPYLLDFVLPNVFFHATIAYALLRHQGVPVGKMDYIGLVAIKQD